MSNLQQQRLVVEQLRREAAIKRITVRQAVADIMVYLKLLFPFENKSSLNVSVNRIAEVCFRSPARRLSDDRFQLTKSQSFPREKQLLSTLNRRQTFSFALVLYLADGKWTISRCKAYRRISSIFFSFFLKNFQMSWQT